VIVACNNLRTTDGDGKPENFKLQIPKSFQALIFRFWNLELEDSLEVDAWDLVFLRRDKCCSVRCLSAQAAANQFHGDPLETADAIAEVFAAARILSMIPALCRSQLREAKHVNR
jgi:hypothetical protein